MFDQISLIQSKIVSNILENNQVILTGNVGNGNYDNLKLQTFEDGGCIINFTLATHYERMDMSDGKVNEVTTWHKVTARGAIAKRIADEVSESDYITLTGFLQQRQYTTKEGTNCIISEVHVIKFRVLDKKIKATQTDRPINTMGYTTFIAEDGSTIYTGADNKPVMPWKNIPNNPENPKPVWNNTSINANVGNIINNQSGQKSFLDI